MAYDHNFRQKKNAQQAAEKTFEPKSHRDERILLSHASRSTWLATFAILGLMGAGYWIVDHFGTQGVKASQQRAERPVEAPANDSIAEINEEGSEQNTEKSLSMPLEKKTVESAPKALDEPAPKATHEVLATPGISNETDEKPVAENISDKPLTVKSMPVPQEALSKPQMTFYDDMQELEVPLDDAEKYPIKLEVPEFIVAGSFFSEAQAQKELKRLTSYGQKLRLTVQHGKNRTVYVLRTEPYSDRKKLGARKNALRNLGAAVRSYKVKK